MSLRRMVTEADREEISRGIAEHAEGRVISERIGRNSIERGLPAASPATAAGPETGRWWPGGPQWWRGAAAEP